MVQQIASVKTESAALTLPFSLSPSAISVQSETRQSFNNEFLRQTNANNVYEQPRQPYQNDRDKYASAQNQKAGSYSTSEKRDNFLQQQATDNQKRKMASEQAREKVDQRREQREELATGRNTNDVNQPVSTLNQKDKNNAGSGISETAKVGKEQKTKIIDNTASDYSEAPAASGQSSPAKAQSEITDVNEVSSSKTEAESLLKQQGSSEAIGQQEHQIAVPSTDEVIVTDTQFDYIDFVTQLAEFTGTSVNEQAPKSETNKTVNDISGELNLSPALGNDIDPQKNLDMPIEDATVEKAVEITLPLELIELTELVNELSESNTSVNLKLSTQDFQALAELQERYSLNNTELTSNDKREISRIVDDLLKQIEGINKSLLNAETKGFSDQDKALLADVLLNPPLSSVNNLQAGEIEKLTSTERASIIVDPLISKSTEKPNETIVTSKNASELNSTVVDDVLGKISQKNEPLRADKANNASEVTITDASIEKLDGKLSKESNKFDSAGSALKNIAQLNDEQVKLALDSVRAKIQTFASEVSTENKGNDFIAALQSGVKEFKQQLAQGREPGIDIKAMLAEALAQVSGEASSTQQPKIDAVLNQLNTVLGVANVVNHSANQQQMLGAERMDAQMTKDFSIQQLEGTKLANGIQNQLNSQASIDKAINIFKQEGQQQLAEKVRWMVNAKNTTAEIRLDPPDLGGINIKINLSGDVAQVNFNVQSAAAKEALDQAAPRLREMLQEQGIELGQSNVQQDSQQQSQGEASNDDEAQASSLRSQPGSEQASIDESVISSVEQRITSGVLGGIDYYA